MNYPIWISEALSGAQLIAIIAVFHVFISHFAVGMGLYVVLTEKIAIKSGNLEEKVFVKKSSALILLISAVLGALTGVGIWFSIALVSPAGTAALIHIFVWGWATEWIFFVLEIFAILAYYYTWNKVSDSTHVFLGWLYFIGAWMSLAIIAGIIAFQLTPGTYLEDKSFWGAFFNPTYFPSVVGRTGISFVLAGIYATLVLSFTKNKEIKVKYGRFTGYFIIAGAVLTFLGMYWWVQAIPEEVREQFLGGNEILSSFYNNSIYLTIALIVLAAIFTLAIPKYMNIAFALVLLILGQASFGYYEFTRERVRKPYVIRDFMYSNGILKNEVEKIKQVGFLNYDKWATVGQPNDEIGKGRRIYNSQCRICHMPQGFNEMYSKVEGLTAEDLYGMLDDLDANPLMPPFAGNDADKQALSKYLEKIGQGGK
ncbi:cytochrome ubiquinol oxidase subunit I [Deferribacteraceae bacterium V6Fe1]|nr:cytochrome ubiquinol oxidase subunit I [Deferribacteraceae bacterium V6Fe1]